MLKKVRNQFKFSQKNLYLFVGFNARLAEAYVAMCGRKKIHVHLDNHISHSRSQTRNFLPVETFLQDNLPYI